MPTRPLVIIHGWSDRQKSFQRLSRLLAQSLQVSLAHIHLGDYVSMEDNITFADLSAALMRAWRDKNLPTKPRSVDVVVHSMGGLVIRSWITRYFTAAKVPIKHLLMLAPANFGSHLAHKGRAFYARAVKGFKGKKVFHTGTQLLHGLELASPFSWQLALQDRFGVEDYYGPGKILCTVLAGQTGYSGIQAAANEVGSDGTVRSSSSNLNCALLTVDFNYDPMKPKVVLKQSNGMTAFGIMLKDNHSTIAAKENGPKDSATLVNIVKALKISDKKFLSWCSELQLHNQHLLQQCADHKQYQGYQNTVTLVKDQFGFHVDDYFIEFYEHAKKNSWLAELFHGSLITKAHIYRGDKSYRNLYINCTELEQHLHKPWEDLAVSLTAMPEIDKKRNLVGYQTYGKDHIGAVKINKTKIHEFFVPNRTLLVDIKIRREQKAGVFGFFSGRG